MIHAIKVINHVEDELVIPITDPITWTETLKSRFDEIASSGFIIRDITGITPGKAVVNMPSYASLDGGIYASSRKDIRNIVISLLFDNSKDIESVRHQTYYWFPLRREITLIFYTDQRTLKISGYVESNEPLVFTNSEGTDVSILCPDPMFIATDEDVSRDFSRDTPLMGFRMDFDGLDEDEYEDATVLHYGTEAFGPNATFKPLVLSLVGEKPFIMGTRIVDPGFNFLYEGDTETGVKISITANSGTPTGVLNIYSIYSEQLFQLDLDKIKDITGTAFQKDDQILINTTPGHKNIQLLRAGRYTNILNVMVRGSDWITMFKGDNYIRYLTDQGYDFLDFHFEYQARYEGV